MVMTDINGFVKKNYLTLDFISYQVKDARFLYQLVAMKCVFY